MVFFSALHYLKCILDISELNLFDKLEIKKEIVICAIRSDARPSAFIVRVVYNEEMFGDKMGVTDTDGDQNV